jgi:hypothetical protein
VQVVRPGLRTPAQVPPDELELQPGEASPQGVQEHDAVSLGEDLARSLGGTLRQRVEWPEVFDVVEREPPHGLLPALDARAGRIEVMAGLGNQFPRFHRRGGKGILAEEFGASGELRQLLERQRSVARGGRQRLVRPRPSPGSRTSPASDERRLRADVHVVAAGELDEAGFGIPLLFEEQQLGVSRDSRVQLLQMLDIRGGSSWMDSSGREVGHIQVCPFVPRSLP